MLTFTSLFTHKLYCTNYLFERGQKKKQKPCWLCPHSPPNSSSALDDITKGWLWSIFRLFVFNFCEIWSIVSFRLQVFTCFDVFYESCTVGHCYGVFNICLICVSHPQESDSRARDHSAAYGTGGVRLGLGQGAGGEFHVVPKPTGGAVTTVRWESTNPGRSLLTDGMVFCWASCFLFFLVKQDIKWNGMWLEDRWSLLE